jgi:DNA-binding transcriptional ArsR family regulator
MVKCEPMAPLDALGDPSRRAIVELLRIAPRSVGALADALPVSRPAVSQHLKVLADAGLVRATARGTRRIYELDPTGAGVLHEYVDQLWRSALGRLADVGADTQEVKP